MRIVHEDNRITVYLVTNQAEAKAKAEEDRKAKIPPARIIPWKGADGRDYMTYVW